MSLAQTVVKAAKAAGTEEKVMEIENVISSLQGSNTKNIAVLGEANCGKTSLINKLAGTEVRKPTKLSMEEEPIMVTFHNGETKKGYQIVEVNAPKCEEAGISLYEIPITMAVESETGQTSLMLEEMDAIIYITSAVTPFSGSDAANIQALISKFPFMLYVSKADLLNSEEEYSEAMDYIRDEFSQNFEGVVCEILDSQQPDAEEILFDGIKDLDLNELREFHIMRLEQRAKEITAQGLRQQLEQLEIQRHKREEQEAEINAAYREQLLEWEEFRLRMLEKKQEAIEAAQKITMAAKAEAARHLIERLEKAGDKKDWINHQMGKYLQIELESASQDVMEELKRRTQSDAEWLINKVTQKFGVTMTVADMRENEFVQINESPRNTVENPKKDKLLAAAGSGLIAGGAVLSSMSWLPTCIIAAPAVWAMHHFVKRNREEQEQYQQNMERIVQECCDNNFNILNRQSQTAIDSYYEYIVENIRNLSSKEKTTVDFGDIENQRRQFLEILDKLMQEV